MIYRIIFFIVLVSFVSCKKSSKRTGDEAVDNKTVSKIADVSDLKTDSKGVNKVLVIAHRGDWRNAPENSLQAIQNCINMGVDIVEIDVQLTKDSIPVLMHDKTIDRTTTGKGEVKEWTLDSLKTLFLKNGANHPTHHKVPTLKEALHIAKGKIILNLDKCYDYFDVIYPLLEEANMKNQILMKGNVSVKEVKKDFKAYLSTVSFMPVINLDKKGAPSMVNDYLNNLKPVAIEFVFSDTTSTVIKQFDSIHNLGVRIWVNSLWEDLNAGYEDDMAVKNPDSIYGWYIKNKISMIQTDRPQLLLNYLRNKELHE